MEWLSAEQIGVLCDSQERKERKMFVHRSELERAVTVLIEDYHKSWEGKIPPTHAELHTVLRKHFGLLYKEKVGYLLLI